jgi:hypothetical protein
MAGHVYLKGCDMSMRDLLCEIINAKKIMSNWSKEKLFEIATNFKNDAPDNNAMWDYGAGEEVCGFSINSKLVAYAHEKLPICFCSSEFEKYKTVCSDVLWFVATEDFYKDEWFVDLKKLKETIPEIQWCACIEAVNPESFSIDGFRFATH